MPKRLFFFAILLVGLFNCANPKKNTSQFVYESGDSRVELKILNGNNYIIYDTPTRVDFLWKNIDMKTGSIYGPGIKMLGSNNGKTKTEISVPSNFIESDTLNVVVSFELKNERTRTEFKVPLVRSE